MRKVSILLLAMALASGGCGTAQNVDNMDKSTQQMAEFMKLMTEYMRNMSELSVEARAMLAQMRKQFEDKPAVDTPDIDDIEGEQ